MSKMRKILAVGVSAVTVVAGLALTTSPAQAQVNGVQADQDCPSGSNPNNFPGTSTTPRPTVSSGGRVYELRYNSTARCAWGRVTRGTVGDQVWVDWSRDGGRTWIQLGVTQINSGTTKFTNAYNDSGFSMRACGQPGDRSFPLVCTGWY